MINLDVKTGGKYQISLPMSEHYDYVEVKTGSKYRESYSDRNGQVVTVFHDSAHLGGNEISRSHCIVEDETGHRFIIRKLCLTPHQSSEEVALLYEHGAIGCIDGDDNHIALGDTSVCNHE